MKIDSHHRNVVVLASLLAVGTVAWEHGFHAYVLGHADSLAAHLAHAVRDALLALPLAFLAVMGSFRVAASLGLCSDRSHDLVARAALVSIAFALLMVPAVSLHDAVDAVFAGQAQAFLQNTSLGGQLRHGVEDALIGLVAAFPLAFLGLALGGRTAAIGRPLREFRRVGASTAKQEGTGLGLALCHKFVELHGGKIGVTSEVRVGLTFTIPVRGGGQ